MASRHTNSPFVVLCCLQLLRYGCRPCRCRVRPRNAHKGHHRKTLATLPFILTLRPVVAFLSLVSAAVTSFSNEVERTFRWRIGNVPQCYMVHGYRNRFDNSGGSSSKHDRQPTLTILKI